MANLLANGINQPDLVTLLALLRTNWNGILTKLDADVLVADTNYNSLHAVTLPSGIQTSGVKAIHNQGDIVTFLNNFITQFNAALTKLDADGGVTDTNYNALWAITDVVGNSKVDGIIDAGIYQESLIKLLNTIIVNIAGLNAKLDADAGVTDTNYAALWNVADTVKEEFSRSRPRISGAAGFIIGFLFSALMGMTQPSKAGEPVFIISGPNSSYTVSHSTISVSSTSVTSIASYLPYRYRKLWIQDVTGGTSFYFTVSASTQNVTTIGRLHKATQDPVEVENAEKVNIQLPAGIADKVLNIMQILK